MWIRWIRILNTDLFIFLPRYLCNPACLLLELYCVTWKQLLDTDDWQNTDPRHMFDVSQFQRVWSDYWKKCVKTHYESVRRGGGTLDFALYKSFLNTCNLVYTDRFAWLQTTFTIIPLYILGSFQ
jgi:hypothetical protein